VRGFFRHQADSPTRFPSLPPVRCEVSRELENLTGTRFFFNIWRCRLPNRLTEAEAYKFSNVQQACASESKLSFTFHALASFPHRWPIAARTRSPPQIYATSVAKVFANSTATVSEGFLICPGDLWAHLETKFSFHLNGPADSRPDRR
jgi:hypothetical protein